MHDTTGPGCSKVGSVETGACMDNTRTINDDKSEGVEGKVDIVVKEKQIDANSNIYYAMHLGENKTPTTPDKTNKTLILISS